MNARTYIMWCFTFASFAGVVIALGRWLDEGGPRPIVTAVIMLLIFIICMPTATDDKEDS